MQMHIGIPGERSELQVRPGCGLQLESQRRC